MDDVKKRFCSNGCVINGGVLESCQRECKTLTVPMGVVCIEEGVFENCEALEKVSLPPTLVSIGRSAFASCKKLRSVCFNGGCEVICEDAFSGCCELRRIKLPDTLERIGNGAFKECTSLRKIDIPSGVHEIGKEAFSGCSSIRQITLPSGLAYIGSDAFARCRGLRRAELPHSLETVRESTFEGCTSLESVRLNRMLKRIGESAFAECKSLVRMEFDCEELSEIAANAFLNCDGLESLTLPKGLRDIGESAFYSCSKLKSIKLPSTVELIRDNAFAYCTRLELIDIPRDAVVRASSFESCVSLPYEGMLFMQNEKIYAANVSSLGNNHIIVPDGTVQISAGVFRDVYVNLHMNIRCPFWRELPGPDRMKQQSVPLFKIHGSSITFRDSSQNTLARVILATSGESQKVLKYAPLYLRSVSGSFDFASYDGAWRNLAVPWNRVITALFRLQYPYMLSDEAGTEYERCMKSDGGADVRSEVCRYLIRRGFRDTLAYTLKHYPLDREHILGLIDTAQLFNDTDSVAILLEAGKELPEHTFEL